MPQVKVIKFNDQEKRAVSAELEAALSKKVDVLGMVACNVYAFAHSSELSLAWEELTRMKKETFGESVGHHGALRSFMEIASSVNAARKQFFNPRATQRFDIIVFNTN